MVASRTTSEARRPRLSVICLTEFSTTITELSTTKPKSMAPRLIRLPAIPHQSIISTAKNMASGMAQATTSPARRFPKSRNSTAMTSSPPSDRFFSTVRMVLRTRSVRS